MQVVEVKPSNNLTFKIPNNLTCKFSVGNLTLRTVCIYVVSLHPHIISVSPQTILIDAFQETQINVLLHWSQQINCLFKSKIRVYIWELFDDESLSAVVTKMFNQETDGSCLLYEQLTVDVELDSKYLKRVGQVFPLTYNISRILLPNMSIVIMTEKMIHKVLSHCQKLAKVKAIYTFDSQYVVQFNNLDDVISSFCEVRDQDDRMAIFGISCIPNLGSVIYSPDILILAHQQSSNQKINPKREKEFKQSVRQSFVKQIQVRKVQAKKQQQIKKQIIEEINNQEYKDIKQEPMQPMYEIENKKIQQINQINQINQIKTQTEQRKNNEKKQKQKQKVQKKQKQIHHSKQIFVKHNPKDLVKQSFFVTADSAVDRSTASRNRPKSQQFTEDYQQDYSSGSVDINKFYEWRQCRDFQVRPKKQFQQKTIDVSKKILNMELSLNQKHVYLLLRDCVMICDVQNISSKRVVKFESIDTENIHLPTPMLLFNKEKTLIFANESYIYWVSISGDEQSDWKYVQRKQIYCIQVVEELNLLMVGGKNFSKLAYLGKSTQRSNLKVYSCGKLGKREHLFTYDIPNCSGQTIIEMKYILTKPNNTKLLLAVTHMQRIFFLRVRAFDHIEVYSVMQTQEIGIQQIKSLNYHMSSSILVCLEKLAEDAYCFKYLKINCSYEKVEISTQSLKLPVVKYTNGFRLGGQVGNQWLTAVDANNVIYSYYLHWKQPQKTQYKSFIKDCVILQRGALFRQNTQVRSRLLSRQ